MKIPLADQINAVERAAMGRVTDFASLEAAAITLKLFARFEIEVRACLTACLAKKEPAVRAVLEQWPDAEVRVRDKA